MQSFRLKCQRYVCADNAGLVIMCMFASLPFLFLSKLSFTDAYFEAMSGITTTGSTVLRGLINYPAILLWRSLLQWLGGIGIIILAVAVPYLNIGGMKLFQMDLPIAPKKTLLVSRLSHVIFWVPILA